MKQINTKLFIIIFWGKCFCTQGQSENPIYSFKIEDKIIYADTIRNGLMIPRKSFDKIIRSEQNNYILFNSLNTNALLLKADIVRENFSIEANRFSKSVEHLAYGAKVQANYSNAERNEAAVYTNGRFLSTLKFEGNIKYFLDGGSTDKFGDRREERKKYFKEKLTDLQDIWEKEARVLEKINELNKKLADDTLNKDSKDEITKDLYFWNNYSLSKTFGKEEVKAMRRNLTNKLEEIYSDAPYKSRNFEWLSFGIQHFNNSYNTFDQKGNTVNDKFKVKQFANWEVDFSYNKLIVKENITFWSAGISYVEDSNADELRTQTYIKTTPVENTKDTLSIRSEVKTLNHEKLDYRDSFKVNLNLVQGLNAIWKTGFDERFSFDFRGNAWNRLGYFFPVYNATNKVVTVIQVYWGARGKLNNFRELRNWDSEIGFAIGLPINLDASLNK